MLAIKKCLVMFFAFSLLVAGMPSLAKADCMMMNMGDMKNCPDMAKSHQSDKGTCCGDMSCAVQCSTAANVSLNGFISGTPTILSVSVKEAFYPASEMLTFSWSNTQERPPKHLS